MLALRVWCLYCDYMDNDELTTTIEGNLVKPKSATVDGQSVEQQDLDQLIEADKYLAIKRAAAQSHRGLSFTTMKQPGARG